MSSIIIEYNDLYELWVRTKSIMKVTQALDELPSATQEELIKYIQGQVDFVAAIADHLGD